MFPSLDLFPEYNPERDPFNPCGYLMDASIEDAPLSEIYEHLADCENCRFQVVSDHFMYQAYHDELFAEVPVGLGLEDFFRTFILQHRQLRDIYTQVRENLKRKILLDLHPLVSLMASIGRVLRYKAEGPDVLLGEEFPILLRKYQRLMEEYGKGEALFLLGVSHEGFGSKTDEAYDALLRNWRIVLGIEKTETSEAS